MNDRAPPFVPVGRGRFPTTQWSLVLHAGAGTKPGAQAALENLCRRYWYPLYAFVRRQGRSHHEAEDCTQEFLARLLSADGMARARSEHGRFRTFLLSSLRHFLTNEWHRDHAAKRGGGLAPLSFDAQEADARFAAEPADPALTPDQAFDRSWAHGLIDAALGSLRNEYEKGGRGAVFATLVPFVWGNSDAGSVARAAGRIGLTEQAFTVALHRLRRRVGERLRATVAETVDRDEEIDAELRHLIAAIRLPG